VTIRRRWDDATAAQRALLELSDEREWWLRRALRAEKHGYQRGHAAGHAEGYRHAAADLESEWQAIARPAARGVPPHAGLELLRWGPGGRERFGEARPGDYAGGPVEWDGPGRASGAPSVARLPGDDALRRVRAAEAGCNRDAGKHERAFIARSRATPPDRRSEVQRATLDLYPAGPRRERHLAVVPRG
jgi:hypothetical protein